MTEDDGSSDGDWRADNHRSSSFDDDDDDDHEEDDGNDPAVGVGADCPTAVSSSASSSTGRGGG